MLLEQVPHLVADPREAKQSTRGWSDLIGTKSIAFLDGLFDCCADLLCCDMLDLLRALRTVRAISRSYGGHVWAPKKSLTSSELSRLDSDVYGSLERVMDSRTQTSDPCGIRYASSGFDPMNRALYRNNFYEPLREHVDFNQMELGRERANLRSGEAVFRNGLRIAGRLTGSFF